MAPALISGSANAQVNSSKPKNAWTDLGNGTAAPSSKDKYGQPAPRNAYTNKASTSANAVTNGTTADTAQDVTHQSTSSYFIGPLCENMPFFRRNVETILREVENARMAYFPEDGVSDSRHR